MTKDEMQQEALDRAQAGQSVTNYPAIYSGFMAMGIAESDIKPRENVLTFHAWKAKGRSVMKGQHGVRVHTFIVVGGTENPETGETEGGYRKPHTSVVFHVSQTEPTADAEARWAKNKGERRDTGRAYAGWRRGRSGRQYPTHHNQDQSWRNDPGEQAADRWNETHGDRWVESDQ